MGHLLDLIVERNRPLTGLMISALVTYLDARRRRKGLLRICPGPGPALPQGLSAGKTGLLGRAGERAAPVLLTAFQTDSAHTGLTHAKRRPTISALKAARTLHGYTLLPPSVWLVRSGRRRLAKLGRGSPTDSSAGYNRGR